jgi:hypothetical protein
MYVVGTTLFFDRTLTMIRNSSRGSVLSLDCSYVMIVQEDPKALPL